MRPVRLLTHEIGLPSALAISVGLCDLLPSSFMIRYGAPVSQTINVTSEPAASFFFTLFRDRLSTPAKRFEMPWK
jgi:hypothetical protein